GVTVILTLAGAFLWITLRDHYQDVARTHTIDVMRLSSLIENDIAALEIGHRGFLLTGKPDYLTGFERRKASIEKDIQDLKHQLGERQTQQKRVLKAQEIVQKWIDTTGLPEI